MQTPSIHCDDFTPPPSKTLNADDVVELWLTEAKNLHKSACSNKLSRSMPVLRRILAVNALLGLSLPELQKQNSMIKRKHLLHTLALENGFNQWGAFKQHILSSETPLLPISHELREAGYPVLWFAELAEAVVYQQKNGGKLIEVGQQAVVV